MMPVSDTIKALRTLVNSSELGSFWLGMWENVNGKTIEPISKYEAISHYLEANKHLN